MIIGTRGSALALAQARLIAGALGGDVELRPIRTSGDRTDRPMRDLADDAFVGSIEQALRERAIDAAVHSLKDLPTAGPADLVLAAIPAREDPRDALVTRARGGLPSLPRGATVGTSSPRRAAFLRALRPDVAVREIRGNVDSRLRRVTEGELDAVVLAAAGLRRLGVAVADAELLDPRDCPPAPGQGALAVQVRAADTALRARVAALDHAPTRRAVTAERELLRLLGATCLLALGALGRDDADELVLEAAFATDDRGLLRASVRGRDPLEVAARAADALGASAHA